MRRLSLLFEEIRVQGYPAGLREVYIAIQPWRDETALQPWAGEAGASQIPELKRFGKTIASGAASSTAPRACKVAISAWVSPRIPVISSRS